MKLSTAHKIGRFFQYFVLILVGVIMIYPLVWMVGATFKSNAEIFSGIGFLTANPTLQGYIDAVTQNYGGDISIWHVRFTDDGDLPFADANIQQPGRQPTFRVIRAVDIDQHVHIL